MTPWPLRVSAWRYQAPLLISFSALHSWPVTALHTI
jgi:hypothetical protein